MDEAKQKVARRNVLNALFDRLDALPNNIDGLALVKAVVAETLKHPDITEEERLEVLVGMENGGYEALLHMLQHHKVSEGFDPTNRPWNRN